MQLALMMLFICQLAPLLVCTITYRCTLQLALCGGGGGGSVNNMCGGVGVSGCSVFVVVVSCTACLCMCLCMEQGNNQVKGGNNKSTGKKRIGVPMNGFKPNPSCL